MLNVEKEKTVPLYMPGPSSFVLRRMPMHLYLSAEAFLEYNNIGSFILPTLDFHHRIR